MGYESRLYIADRHVDELFGESFEVIATVELSKAGFNRKHQNQVFCNTMLSDKTTIFGNGASDTFELKHDEDKHRYYYDLTDCYGDPIKWGTLEDVRNLIISKDADMLYRRFKVALGILDTFINLPPDTFDNLVVLHFGH